MKLITAISTVILTSTLSLGATAAEPQNTRDSFTGFAKFTGGAIIGGLVGGPFGAVVGAAGGGIIAEKGFEHEASKRELAAVHNDMAYLEREISLREAKIAELEEETLARLELKVFFDTGVDQVTGQNEDKVKAVADYLDKHTQVHIRLDGHADSRGTDEYNNVLSQERALAVKALLVEQGIAEHRITVNSHGAAQSSALAGGEFAYQQDRRVDIALEFPPTQALSSVKF